MAKKPKLTPKEVQIVNAKVDAVLTGKSQREIAPILYPDASQSAAEVEVSKNLNKPNVQQALQEALAKHGITIEQATKPIADGLKANRVAQVEGDFFETEVPDHSIRLKASSMALDVLGAKNKEAGGNTFNFVQVVQEQKDKYGI